MNKIRIFSDGSASRFKLKNDRAIPTSFPSKIVKRGESKSERGKFRANLRSLERPFHARSTEIPYKQLMGIL